MKTGSDVAQAAGVSVATVSAVFSGQAAKRRISPETERRIRKIAADLNYTPNPFARDFRRGRSFSVGILLPVPNDNGYTRIVSELGSLLAERGFFASFAFWNTQAEQKIATESILSRRPEALVTVEPKYLPDSLKIPVVTLFEHDPRFDFVTVDRNAIWSESLDFLSGLGHTRIGTVSLVRENDVSRNEELREASVFFRNELRRRGIPGEYASDLVSRMNRMDRAAVAEVTADWLLAFPPDRRPTALILDEDVHAAYLIRALANRGWSLPRNLSIVSSGNSLLGRAVMPAISTFGDVSPECTISRRAAELIFARMENPALPPSVSKVKYTLIRRESALPFSGMEWSVHA